MTRGEFLKYLSLIGFSEKVKSIGPYKKIKLEFDDPIVVNEFEAVFGLFSSKFSMWVDFDEGNIKRMDEVSENTSKLIFEWLENGAWDFI